MAYKTFIQYGRISLGNLRVRGNERHVCVDWRITEQEFEK
jgi:hypothetical protein